MRLSLPHPYVLQASAALVAVCGAVSCTQKVVVEAACPPSEYPAVNIPSVQPPPSEAAVPRTLDVRLTPARNEAGNVVAVDVAMRFSVPPVDFGDAAPIVLRLDPHIAGAAIADRIDDLTARDSEGSLGLRLATESNGGKPTQAEWTAGRRARGPVTVNYRVQLLAEDAARDEVIASAGGLLGAGRALFLIPATTESYAIRVDWDLQSFGPGAHGTSSFGIDAAEVDGPPSLLENAIWVAGSLEEIAIRASGTNGRSGGRFRMVSLGKTAFDVTEAGPWVSRAWQSVRAIGPQTSGVDLFVYAAGKPGPRWDIDVFGQSALIKTQADVKFGWPEKLRFTEMSARIVRGNQLMSRRWFDEGFGTYMALDALRANGLATPAELAAEISKRSERYFSSPWLKMPLSELIYIKDDPAQAQIDDRGMQFAAELDGKIRVASGGKRSFVDFIRSLEPPPAATDATDVPKATSVSLASFLKGLEKEIGADAVARYQAVVESASGQANAADDAFGPCFKKVKKKIQREDAASKKKESVDGYTFAVVPKLPASCANVTPAPVTPAAAPKKNP